MTAGMSDASVHLWGRRIGAVSWDRGRDAGVFQYDPAFSSARVEPSPIVLPVGERPVAFPELGRETFRGLPGLLADALPDRFGSRLMDFWQAAQGPKQEALNPVEQLHRIGAHGMGALAFEPARRFARSVAPLEIPVLADLAVRIQRRQPLPAGGDRETLRSLVELGAAIGGAQAKAVVAWNPSTSEFRAAPADPNAGFEDWILKFDSGTAGARGRIGMYSRGGGRIEYAYHRMALDAGIEMSACRLHEQEKSSHFMTRRFDRTARGRTTHMQSLGALRHFDYGYPGAYSYEQVMETIRLVGLGMPAVEEQFRRAVFNVVARNQDDHVKNVAFLMDTLGKWRLSPAYDVVFAFNPTSFRTRNHQMSLAGKRDHFERDDLMRFAMHSGIRRRAAMRILDEVLNAVAGWPGHAAAAGVPSVDEQRIGRTHRMYLRG